MRSILLFCLAFVVACPASQKDAPEGARPTQAQEPAKEESPMDSSRSAHPACTDLACLSQHEGELVQAEGTFVFPKEQAFARNKLSLSDGTTIILPQAKDDAVRARFTADNDGKKMKIVGRIYTKEIPEKYRIIGRTPDPYLVDIESAELN
jgi:hypothetical protein